MTIGAGTYHPGVEFASPRSYVEELTIARYGDGLTRSANVFTIHAPPPDPTVAIIVFRADWFAWSSRTYKLSSMVQQFYALGGGVPPEIPLPFSLSYGKSPLTNKTALLFEWFSGIPDWQAFSLAAAPKSYWLPKPLP